VGPVPVGEVLLDGGSGVLGHQIGGDAAFDDASGRHEGDLVGEAFGLLDVVGGHHHGDPFGAQGVDEAPQVLAYLGVQADGGFVHEDEVGSVEQGPEDEETATHPAGQVVDDGVPAVLELGQAHGAGDRVPALPSRHSVQVGEHP